MDPSLVGDGVLDSTYHADVASFRGGGRERGKTNKSWSKPKFKSKSRHHSTKHSSLDDSDRAVRTVADDASGVRTRTATMTTATPRHMTQVKVP